ncbi:MAG: hypothetical protein KGO81_06020 [Bacteroidota bacterium]|nr:hypothetical protein [Bacteroidota bacterium]
MGTLVIKRKKAIVDFLDRYSIYIDKKFNQTIAANQVVKITFTDTEEHTLHFSKRVQRSAEFSFTGDSENTFEVGPNTMHKVLIGAIILCGLLLITKSLFLTDTTHHKKIVSIASTMITITYLFSIIILSVRKNCFNVRRI